MVRDLAAVTRAANRDVAVATERSEDRAAKAALFFLVFVSMELVSCQAYLLYTTGLICLATESLETTVDHRFGN
jgi:hypothetical protein